MKFLLTILLVVLSVISFSQNRNANRYYVQISSGRVLFGTGDVVGFSINIEGSKNIISHPKRLLNKLLVGAELSFENGTKKPVIDNPTPEEFISKSFNHISNSIISGKITYYPFSSLFRGFNISIGPSVGHTFHSSEKRAERVTYSPTLIRRMSDLKFENGIILGYRITSGYEFKVSQRISAGFRLDFANYDNGDINTLAAVKVVHSF